MGVGVGVVEGGGQTSFSAGGQMRGAGAWATSGCGGGEAQPATTAQSAARQAAAVDDNVRTEFVIGRSKVGWVFLEIIAALAIAIGIVWWTLPKKPRPDDERSEGDGKE